VVELIHFSKGCLSEPFLRFLVVGWKECIVHCQAFARAIGSSCGLMVIDGDVAHLCIDVRIDWSCVLAMVCCGMMILLDASLYVWICVNWKGMWCQDIWFELSFGVVCIRVYVFFLKIKWF
jgi:hypothetical protein